MAEVFFSGVDRQKYADWLESFNIMVSPPTMAHKIGVRNRKLVDSGAGGGRSVSLSRYAEIINFDPSQSEWWPTLDVVMDQEQTDRNHDGLLSKVSSDARIVWIHQPDSGLSRLRQQLEKDEFVCIGGIAKIKTKIRMSYIESVGKVLAEFGAYAHFFGVGDMKTLTEFSGEPWFASTDCTSWMCGIKSGEILNNDGSRVSCSQFNFTAKEISIHNARQIQKWANGVSDFVRKQKSVNVGDGKRLVQLSLV